MMDQSVFKTLMKGSAAFESLNSRALHLILPGSKRRICSRERGRRQRTPYRNRRSRASRKPKDPG